MGSWIKPNTYTGIPDPEAGTTFVINGYKIYKPGRFKNLAHERAFEIALVLAEKKAEWSGVHMMTTSECTEVIMFNGLPEIQLHYNAACPQKVTIRSMEFVPSFFDPETVKLDQRKKGRKMWFLEIKPNYRD